MRIDREWVGPAVYTIVHQIIIILFPVMGVFIRWFTFIQTASVQELFQSKLNPSKANSALEINTYLAYSQRKVYLVTIVHQIIIILFSAMGVFIRWFTFIQTESIQEPFQFKINQIKPIQLETNTYQAYSPRKVYLAPLWPRCIKS